MTGGVSERGLYIDDGGREWGPNYFLSKSLVVGFSLNHICKAD